MIPVYDLSIIAGDLAFGPDGEPLFLEDAAAIAQDVKHRLRERGLAEELIADEGDYAVTRQRILREVEEDTRIRPGTATMEVDTTGGWIVRARTTLGATIAQILSS